MRLSVTNRTTPEHITGLNSGEVFVFGSNLAGIHGAGAARAAHIQWNAQWGVGYGMTGQCFAIPTKGYQIETISLDAIEIHVDNFIRYAKAHPSHTFLVTEIGCGLAGYEPEHIAPLFYDAMDVPNICLPERFWQELNMPRL